MQSKTSFFNKAIYRRYLKRSAVLSVIFTLILCLSWPYALIIRFVDAKKMGADITTKLSNYYFCEVFGNVPIPTMIGILIFIFLMVNFMFLYNKRDSYMMHAFPVNRTVLFVTGIMAALTSVMAPILLAEALTALVGLIYGVKATVVFSVVLYEFYIALGSSIFFTGFSILTMMFTGQALTAVIFYGILNSVVFGMSIVLSCVETLIGFGLSLNESIIATRPATPMLYLPDACKVGSDCKWNAAYDAIIESSYSFDGAGTMLIFILVGVVFLATAYYLYKIKKIESVNDFINAPGIDVVFTVGMSFFVSAFFGYVTVLIIEELTTLGYTMICVLMIVSTVVYGIILFYFIQMLIAKSVRVFNKKNIIYCAIYSLAAIATILCIKIDIFGIEKKVPSIDDIEFVSLEAKYDFCFSDTEEIEQVINLNNEIVKNKTDILHTQKDDEAYGTISFKYKLKSGKVFTRGYNLPSQELLSTDSYNQLCEDYYALVNRPETIKRHVLSPYYEECDIIDLSYYRAIPNATEDDYDWDYTTKSDATAEDYRVIYEAILKDIDEGNLFVSEMGNYYYDPDYYDNEFYITIASKGKEWIADSDKLYSSYYANSDEHSLTLGLNINCVNIKNALIQRGFCNENDFITRGEIDN